MVNLCTLWSCKDIEHTAALLVSELVTNAILHAHSATTLSASFNRPRLSVAVHDEQPGQLAYPSPGEGHEAGRGLFMVRAFAAEFGVSSDATGKTVWFVLIAPPRPSPRPPPAVERGADPRPDRDDEEQTHPGATDLLT